ncbi:hypothetical protein GH714_037693 [Hevea brasiliensis]|uniref:R13L1/DRL21-like LRR repeat region domain-containing protein n=1 Tax=Hevea brasiliensis TaxID=3981 RepID=A0A6A6L7Y5_HEVBR|nr:hypothetical protein GH714_037693 [Hevea brasiliensis]
MMKIPSGGDSSRVFDNLVQLMLQNCKWCEQLPMLGHLPRLKLLWISGMDKIRSIGNEFYGIGDGSTSNGVRPFPALKVLGFRSMKSLLELKATPVGDIRGRIKSLPDQLQSLTTLKTLNIVYFNGMEALPEWLGNLSSLKYLGFWDCDNLKYLPTATAMRRLSKLTEIRIRGCPFLRANCAKGSGSEWSKISHLPYIHIRELG